MAKRHQVSFRDKNGRVTFHQRHAIKQRRDSHGRFASKHPQRVTNIKDLNKALDHAPRGSSIIFDESQNTKKFDLAGKAIGAFSPSPMFLDMLSKQMNTQRQATDFVLRFLMLGLIFGMIAGTAGFVFNDREVTTIASTMAFAFFYAAYQIQADKP